MLTAGADRTVQVYDSRTWRMRLNWRSPCKYDIIRLLPAQGGRARGIYVCGLDNEVLLCDVTGVEKKPAVAKGVKRKADEDEAAEGGGGPCHAALPDSSKLRISHHRYVGTCDGASCIVHREIVNCSLVYARSLMQRGSS